MFTGVAHGLERFHADIMRANQRAATPASNAKSIAHRSRRLTIRTVSQIQKAANAIPTLGTIASAIPAFYAQGGGGGNGGSLLAR